MQFLWGLLPGAREARNDLIVGYAWLVAVGLWVGVPELHSGAAHELAKASGSLGVGIALSVVAFLLGTFSSDLTRLIPGLREARAFSTGWEDPAAVLTALSDKEIEELNRLEGSIDRQSAEVSFRLSLIPPVVVAGIAAAVHGNWWWAPVTVGVISALVFQSVLRRNLSYADVRASRSIRGRAAGRAGSSRSESRGESAAF